jgi:hypothetical protein
MHKLLLLITIVGLFLMGCQNSKDTGIVGPDNSPTLNGKSISFLKLPANLEPTKSLSKRNPFSVTPKDGGNINYKNSYMSAYGLVEIELQIKFEKNSVSDSMVVSVGIDQNELSGDLSLDFSPSPITFLIPAKLEMSVKGLDPASLPAHASDLILVCNGQVDNPNYFEVIKCKEIKMNKKEGQIEVIDGIIPHFSRYGWGTRN